MTYQKSNQILSWLVVFLIYSKVLQYVTMVYLDKSNVEHGLPRLLGRKKQPAQNWKHVPYNHPNTLL